MCNIWFSLAKLPPICYTWREKVYFCRRIRTYGRGSYEHRAPAVAPFYIGMETWFSLDVFLWEWLYWSCPWCWAEYPAFQHRLGTWVADTRTDSLILILTGVCMYAGFLFSLHWRASLCFDTLRSPDVSGLASDEATLAPVACGGRSDCRELSSFLILFERV